MHKIHHIIALQNWKKNKYIKPGEVAAFLKKMEGRIDEELTKLVVANNQVVYVLKDENVFLFDKIFNHGFVYYDREFFKQLVTTPSPSDEEMARETYPFSGPIEPERLDQLLKDLAELLKIKPEHFDFSLKSFELIDKKLKKIPEKQINAVIAQLYPAILAYVYKTLEIQMPAQIIFVPYPLDPPVPGVNKMQLLDKNGHIYCPAPEIQDTLTERPKDRSVFLIMDSELFKCHVLHQ